MKILFIAAAIYFGTATANAQQIFFNLEGGLNSSKFVYGQKTIVSSSALNRYYLGGTIDIQFNNFAVQPGILFSTNGGNNTSIIEHDSYHETVTNRMTLRYLLFPVNIIHRFAISRHSLLIGGGAYFGYGLEGKNFGETRMDGVTSNHHDFDLYFGYLPENIRNHDFGFDFLTAFEFKRLGVKAAYTLGLRNLSNSSIPPYSKNRILSFGLTYKLAEIRFL